MFERTPAPGSPDEPVAALYESVAVFDAAFTRPVTFYEEPSVEMLMMLDFGGGWGGVQQQLLFHMQTQASSSMRGISFSVC